MQIELVSSAPNAAPGADPASAASEEAAGSGSFADLLDAVADDSTESPVDEDSAEEGSTDEWITAPVLVPFIPVIPVETIEGQMPGATNIEAEEEGTSIEAIDGVVVAATSESPSPEAALIDPAASIPQIGAVAGPNAAAPGAPVEEVPAAAAGADLPAVESANEVETIASMLSNDPVATEPLKKTGIPVPMPETRETPDVAETTTPAQAIASTDAQGAATEGGASNGASVTNDPPVEPTSNHKGVAARLARALERAAEASAPHRAETASGENGQSFTQDADHQPSFGEWLREQLPQVANAGAQAPATPAFSVAPPAHHDSRVSGVIGPSGTSLTPGGPVAPREQDVAMQIVQSLRLQFRDGIGEAVLKLKPEHLGSVAISLRVENGGLKANVQADLPAVRQWLESQQDTLRSALAEHGLRLDRFEVEPDGQRQASPENPQERSPRKRQDRRTQQADQPVFEVVV